MGRWWVKKFLSETGSEEPLAKNCVHWVVLNNQYIWYTTESQENKTQPIEIMIYFHCHGSIKKVSPQKNQVLKLLHALFYCSVPFFSSQSPLSFFSHDPTSKKNMLMWSLVVLGSAKHCYIVGGR